MPLPSVRAALVVAAAALLAWCGWTVAGWRSDAITARQEARQAIAERDAQASARRIQAQRAARQMEIANARSIAYRAVDARLAVALEQLRQRPDRHADLSGATAQTCAGASGAELSGPDAAFLVREAARADRLRAALEACQAGE